MIRGEYITAFHEDNSEKIWVGTKGGLYVSTMNQKERKYSEFLIPGRKNSQEVFQIFTVQNEEILLNAADGMFLLTPNPTKIDISYGKIYFQGVDTFLFSLNKLIQKKVIGPPPLLAIDSIQEPREFLTGGNEVNISKIRVMPTGEIWVSSGFGLFCQKEGNWVKYNSDDGLPFNRVNNFLFTNDSQVWVGTEKGLGLLKEETFIDFPQKEKLSKVNCRSLVLDHLGRLWVGTTEGIYCLDKDELLFFNSYDGLPSDYITSIFIDSKLKLWVGTSYGLASLDLTEPILMPSSPQVHIDEVLVNDFPVTLRDDIVIRHNATFEIFYTAIDFKSAKELEFRYRLNQEVNWISTSNRSLNLSGLRSGEYQFEVAAKKYNSDWSPSQKVSFSVPLFWWERIEVLILIFVALLSILAWLGWRRVKQIKAKSQKQIGLEKQMARLKLSALQGQMNPHFMFNALNAIQHFIINKDQATANEYLSKFSRLMRLFLDSSQETVIVLQEELEMIQNYLELEHLRFEGRFDFSIEIDPDIRIHDIEIPAMLLQPFVENAIIHGLYHKKGKGNLKVSASLENKSLKLVVEDDGIGRKKSGEINRKKYGTTHKSKGQELVKARVHAMNQYSDSQIEVDIEDLYNERQQSMGTRVRIYLQYLLVFFGFLGVMNGTYSQSQEFRRYVTGDGLPHLIGYDMIQDSQGYMWINTDAGVARFDGNEFLSFSLNDSLGKVYPITIGRWKNNELWIGSHKRGLYSLENRKTPKIDVLPTHFRDPILIPLGSNKCMVHELYPPNRKSNWFMVCTFNDDKWTEEHYLLELVQDSLFVLTRHDGIIAKGTFLREYFDDVSLGRIPFNYNRSFVSSSGEIFLITSHGVYQFNKDISITRILADEIPAKPVEAICEDKFGNIWIASGNALFVIDKSKNLIHVYRDLNYKEAYQIEVDDRENVYVLASDRESLFAYNFEDGSYENLYGRFQLNSSISYIELDQDKNLWVTTTGEGVVLMQQKSLFTQEDHEMVLGEYITTFHEDDAGELWIGAKDGLFVSKMGQKEREYAEYLMPGRKKNTEVFQVFSNRNKEVILNAFDGMFLLTSPPVRIGTLIGEIGFQGVDTFLFFSQNFIRRKIAGPVPLSIIDSIEGPKEIFMGGIQVNISQIEVTPSGEIWLASGYGVFHLKEGEWRKYDSQDGLPFNRVNNFLFTSDSQAWVGTEKGLGLLKDGEFIDFSQREKLSKVNCQDLVLDHLGRLWMGTTEGIYCLDKNELLFFNSYDGLPSDYITSIFIDSKFRLWVGTNYGLASLDLTEPILSPDPPQVYIDEVLVNGIPVTLRDDIIVRHNATFEISYTAIDFKSAKKLEFRYRLNQEEDWIFTSSRSLNLSGLRSGEYQFEVAAKKYNSDWSPPQKISFSVPLLWWERIEVLILIFVALLSILSWLGWRRVKQIKAKSQKQIGLEKQMARLKLSALQGQMNPHFMFNALNAIQHFIINKDQATANEYLSKFSRLMRLFLDSSQETVIVLQEELEMIQNYLELEHLRFEGRFDFSIEVDPDIRIHDIEIPAMLLQPFVENAIIHGLYHKKDKGNLKVSVKRKNNSLNFVVEDDGIGRKRSGEINRKKYGTTHKSKGQELVKARIHALNEYSESRIKIDIEDLEDNNMMALGTRVAISFPLNEL